MMGVVDKKGSWCVQGNVIEYSSWYDRKSAVVVGMKFDTKSKGSCDILVGGKSDMITFSTNVQVTKGICKRVAELQQDVIVVGSPSGTPCRLEALGNKFSVTPVFVGGTLDNDTTNALILCAKSEHCRGLGSKLKFTLCTSQDVCNVEYEGVELLVDPSSLKSLVLVDTLDKGAKSKVCLEAQPRAFRPFKGGAIQGYMISNQKLEGCNITLYQEEDNVIKSFTVRYESIADHDDLSLASFQKIWSQDKTAKKVQHTKIDWCQKGNVITFDVNG